MQTALLGSAPTLTPETARVIDTMKDVLDSTFRQKHDEAIAKAQGMQNGHKTNHAGCPAVDTSDMSPCVVAKRIRKSTSRKRSVEMKRLQASEADSTTPVDKFPSTTIQAAQGDASQQDETPSRRRSMLHQPQQNSEHVSQRRLSLPSSQRAKATFAGVKQPPFRAGTSTPNAKVTPSKNTAAFMLGGKPPLSRPMLTPAKARLTTVVAGPRGTTTTAASPAQSTRRSSEGAVCRSTMQQDQDVQSHKSQSNMTSLTAVALNKRNVLAPACDAEIQGCRQQMGSTSVPDTKHDAAPRAGAAAPDDVGSAGTSHVSSTSMKDRIGSMPAAVPTIAVSGEKAMSPFPTQLQNAAAGDTIMAPASTGVNIISKQSDGVVQLEMQHNQLQQLTDVLPDSSHGPASNSPESCALDGAEHAYVQQQQQDNQSAETGNARSGVPPRPKSQREHARRASIANARLAQEQQYLKADKDRIRKLDIKAKKHLAADLANLQMNLCVPAMDTAHQHQYAVWTNAAAKFVHTAEHDDEELGIQVLQADANYVVIREQDASVENDDEGVQAGRLKQTSLTALVLAAGHRSHNNRTKVLVMTAIPCLATSPSWTLQQVLDHAVVYLRKGKLRGPPAQQARAALKALYPTSSNQLPHFTNMQLSEGWRINKDVGLGGGAQCQIMRGMDEDSGMDPAARALPGVAQLDGLMPAQAVADQGMALVRAGSVPGDVSDAEDMDQVNQAEPVLLNSGTAHWAEPYKQPMKLIARGRKGDQEVILKNFVDLVACKVERGSLRTPFQFIYSVSLPAREDGSHAIVVMEKANKKKLCDMVGIANHGDALMFQCVLMEAYAGFKPGTTLQQVWDAAEASIPNAVNPQTRQIGVKQQRQSSSQPGNNNASNSHHPRMGGPANVTGVRYMNSGNAHAPNVYTTGGAAHNGNSGLGGDTNNDFSTSPWMPPKKQSRMAQVHGPINSSINNIHHGAAATVDSTRGVRQLCSVAGAADAGNGIGPSSVVGTAMLQDRQGVDAYHAARQLALVPAQPRAPPAALPPGPGNAPQVGQRAAGNAGPTRQAAPTLMQPPQQRQQQQRRSALLEMPQQLNLDAIKTFKLPEPSEAFQNAHLQVAGRSFMPLVSKVGSFMVLAGCDSSCRQALIERYHAKFRQQDATYFDRFSSLYYQLRDATNQDLMDCEAGHAAVDINADWIMDILEDMLKL